VLVAAVAPAGYSVTVMVKVWDCPTGFVAVCGVMPILASTYCFTAGPLSPDLLSPVARVINTPPTVKVALAFAVIVPAVVLLTTTVQVAVVPEKLTVLPVQLSVTDDGVKPVNVTVTLAVVAAVAAPGACVTVTVKVCALPTSLVALGEIEIDPST